jgi:chromosome segregation ATPase
MIKLMDKSAWFKYLKIVGVVAVVIWAIIGTQRACRIYDENSILKGQYDAMKKAAEENKAAADQKIAELQKTIADKNKEIGEAQEIINNKNKDISKNHAKIVELEKEREGLKDKDATIVNLDKQVYYWKDQFSLCQQVIAEKDKIIFSLTEKYDAQVKISLEWYHLYNEQVNLRVLAERRIDGLEDSLKGLHYSLKVSRTLALILGGIVIYKLIAK